MSKAVRIRDHLYSEIEALAKAERRSLIAQLEVLLEQALKMDGALSERGGRGSGVAQTVERRHDKSEVSGSIPDAGAAVSNPRMPRSESDPHFKPDFK